MPVRTKLFRLGWVSLALGAATVATLRAETYWSLSSPGYGLVAFEFSPQSGASRLTMQAVGDPTHRTTYFGVAREPATGILWALYWDQDLGREALGKLRPGRPRPEQVTLLDERFTFNSAYPQFSPAGVLYAQGLDLAAMSMRLTTIDRTTGAATPVISFTPAEGLLGMAFDPVSGELHIAVDEICGSGCATSYVDRVTMPGYQRTRIFDSNAQAPVDELFFGAGGELFTYAGYFFRVANNQLIAVDEPLSVPSPLGAVVPSLFALTPADGTEGCLPAGDRACLQSRRFAIEATYDATYYGGGTGPATPLLESDQSIKFSFFDPAILELFVKIVDGCSYNGRYWIFASGLTDVGVSLRVTDTVTGAIYHHTSAAGQPFAPVLDIQAFACEP